MDAPVRLLDVYKPLYVNGTRYFVITSGRGAGKSFHVSDFLLKLTYEKGHTILYTRYTMVSANISIIPEFTQKIDAYNLHNVFEVTQNEIINKLTGSNILFKGIKTGSTNNTAALKSIANVTTWVCEELEDLHDENVFDTIDLSIRHKDLQNRVIAIMNPSSKTHFAYKRWFSDVPYDFNGVHKDITYIFTDYRDNIGNLPQSFLEQAERVKQTNINRYNHLFLGYWVDSVEGLLWTRALIDRLRIHTKPETLKRIVVAIDPATTANKNSDETGIVVAGIDAIGNGYVLEDVSGKWSPADWGLLAVQKAKAWNADCIVAETNAGGDLVQAVIRNVDNRIRYKGVHATKGKYTRAEPIFNLYELGKVYHVGQHPLLELQMCTFNPNEGSSPDRVDALVWALTELMLNTREGFVLM
jgi:PBSX family phage terminase large subunit